MCETLKSNTPNSLESIQDIAFRCFVGMKPFKRVNRHAQGLFSQKHGGGFFSGGGLREEPSLDGCRDG